MFCFFARLKPPFSLGRGGVHAQQLMFARKAAGKRNGTFEGQAHEFAAPPFDLGVKRQIVFGLDQDEADRQMVGMGHYDARTVGEEIAYDAIEGKASGSKYYFPGQP